MLLLLFACVLKGQAQKVERYYDYAWKPTTDLGRARYFTLIEKKDSVWERHDYFFQERKLQMSGFYKDEENKIAHGLFHYFHPNGMLQGKGNFVNGKREGLWIDYHDNGMIMDSAVYSNGNVLGIQMSWHPNGYPADSAIFNADGSGMEIAWFDDGTPSAAGYFAAGRKKQGKWQYFHKNGQPSSIEVYKAGELVSKQYFTEEGKMETDTTSKDRVASFPGGIGAWKKYLEKHLSFPSGYKISGADQAVVLISWTVDEEGNVKDARVTGPFHPEFDRIALNVIKKSPRWIPAIQHNRKVKYLMSQPVTFSQE